ncbi:hypothetical protein DN062_14950 [Nitrincola tibetensis]|uniref:KfrA N-terminal DNA-binding domain-containing protein n=1 Tax=Nitrincola tibetensis TaxID=2219697 RepID=A0A364NIW4_9GAMM|nr:DNA-binding protein [Nitrincola tibetensis]RAU17006.1 hypothetical protein DN062_14950 [Nitrincola tibetensis]
MDKEQLKSRVYEVADDLLLSASYPRSEAIAETLEIEPEEVSRYLSQWWYELPQRIVMTDRTDRAISVPGMPDTLAQAFTRIWLHALQEANSKVNFTRQMVDVGLEEDRRVNDDALQKSQHLYLDLESRYREQSLKLEESREQFKALEAEIAVLKNNLAIETNSRKKEEQSRVTIEHELAQLRKAYDDAKRVFDQRIKDEQRHMMEAIAKEEVDTRYYRNTLEKVREEASKKESELVREIHDLQARIARKDVKTDTLKSQVKSQEAELLKYKQDSGVLQRDLSRVNAQLLTEVNKTKRLEAKVKELQEDIRRLNQKHITASNENTKRENMLRSQLVEKENIIIRAEAKVNSLEKRIISNDEEIRRLSSRV